MLVLLLELQSNVHKWTDGEMDEDGGMDDVDVDVDADGGEDQVVVM